MPAIPLVTFVARPVAGRMIKLGRGLMPHHNRLNVFSIETDMKPDSSETDASDRPHYQERTPVCYLDKLDPALRSGLTEPQLEAVRQLLEETIPRPGPKLVDLRFWLDLFAYRFYIVLFVGKDRRGRKRADRLEPMARKGNAIVALMLLIGLNLLVSLFILLIALLIKTAIGFTLFPRP